MYQVKNDKDCILSTQDPLRAIWHEKELGPNVYNPLSNIDQMAYGITSQKKVNNYYQIKLKAIKNKMINLKVQSTNPCKVMATMKINGVESKLTKVYVFAKEGFLPSI